MNGIYYIIGSVLKECKRLNELTTSLRHIFFYGSIDESGLLRIQVRDAEKHFDVYSYEANVWEKTCEEAEEMKNIVYLAEGAIRALAAVHQFNEANAPEEEF